MTEASVYRSHALLLLVQNSGQLTESYLIHKVKKAEQRTETGVRERGLALGLQDQKKIRKNSICYKKGTETLNALLPKGKRTTAAIHSAQI
ncbi:hypothetical protein CHARACLAT_012357 [Characodon lateralis]|uniref:Uncharacterized protein n=1 Tax=Characodon lateralis TaxID=208331 RepID=A0ABU7DZZ3_9TELE|nr:hypothetical protein [Characodon lateralis]